MTRYRVRPPSFEARQFQGMATADDWAFIDWLGQSAEMKRERFHGWILYAGEVALKRGDWVVRDLEGACRVLTNEQFRAEFEPEPEEASQ